MPFGYEELALGFILIRNGESYEQLIMKLLLIHLDLAR